MINFQWTFSRFQSHSENWPRGMQTGLARQDKCLDGNRIMLNASPLLQAIDPLHNIYFLHSSFMPFWTVKRSTCKTQAQVIGFKLINSPGLSISVSLSAISQLSASNNKNNTPSLFVHNLRGWGIDLIITACSKMMQQSGTQAGFNEMDYSQEESDRHPEEQPRAHKNRISTVNHDVRESKQRGGGGDLMDWSSDAAGQERNASSSGRDL